MCLTYIYIYEGLPPCCRQMASVMYGLPHLCVEHMYAYLWDTQATENPYRIKQQFMDAFLRGRASLNDALRHTQEDGCTSAAYLAIMGLDSEKRMPFEAFAALRDDAARDMKRGENRIEIERCEQVKNSAAACKQFMRSAAGIVYVESVLALRDLAEGVETPYFDLDTFQSHFDLIIEHDFDVLVHLQARGLPMRALLVLILTKAGNRRGDLQVTAAHCLDVWRRAMQVAPMRLTD